MIYLPIDVEKLLRKIPRPQRSGWLSIIAHGVLITMLLATGEINLGANSLQCIFMPWTCHEVQNNEYVKKNYHYAILLPNGHGKKPCTCHYDKIVNDGEIQHIHSVVEELCDSDHDYEPNEWVQYIVSYNIDPIKVINYHIRLHCDSEDKKR